jgi:hypothetical protein
MVQATQHDRHIARQEGSGRLGYESACFSCDPNAGKDRQTLVTVSWYSSGEWLVF